MKKQARIFGAFCQGALHLALRFSQIAGRNQRPGQGVVTKDITARIKFFSREPKRGFGGLAAGRARERLFPPIAARARLAKPGFDLMRFVLLLVYPHRPPSPTLLS